MSSITIRQGRVNLETATYTQTGQAVAYGLQALDPHDHFVSEHLQRIFRQIYRIVLNVDDAQDLTQEVFIRALRHRDQLKDEQKAANWLSRIATNAAIDFVRKSNRVSFTELDDTLRRHDDNPEQLLMRAEVRDYLDAGLRLLTSRERAALTLRDVEGLPAEEVALLLECSQATVRSHIANARVKLRGYLRRNKR
jgi:RNA polymerase sigma-70 factor (ECF subfamily)